MRRAVLRTVVIAVAACLAIASSARAQQQKVLTLVETSGGTVQRNFVAAFETALKDSPQSVDLYLESVDFDRFGGVAYETVLEDYLRGKYAGLGIDVVVALGPAVLDFVTHRREELFPGIPIVFAAIRESSVERRPPNTTGVLGEFDLVRTLDLAMTLQPNAARLVVVTGTGPLDLAWNAFAHERLAAYGDRFDIVYLTGEPASHVLEEVGALPRDAIVLLLSMQEDRAGQRFTPQPEIISKISAASSAPVYGVYESFVGNGVVGGHVDSFDSLGRQTAALALRVLGGDSADELPIEHNERVMEVDARQLKRFGLSTSRLPEDAVVLYAEPSIWDAYRGWILGAAALLALQTLAIIALLMRARKLRVERALRRTEARYRQVVEAQTDLVCRYLPDTTLTFVNAAYCRYFGRPREDLIGTKFIELIPEPDRAPTLKHIEDLVREPRSEAYVHQVFRPDGAIGWQQWIDHVIVDDSGEAVEVQGVGRDLTELKRVEAELDQRREQVTHLTRVSILGELSGAFAHELNQPLTAILSNAQAAMTLLDRAPLDIDEIRAILKDIEFEDRRAGEVIARLRTLLKRGRVEFESLDVGILADDVLALARPQLIEDRVAVSVDCAASLPPALADPVQLQQVLLNLMLNACEAMRGNAPGDRRLTVSVGRGVDDSLTIEVHDSGPGLAPDVAGRIFEPFVTTKANGLGLGLAICHSIMAAHGGRLDGRNGSDGGAVFTITLPGASAHA